MWYVDGYRQPLARHACSCPGTVVLHAQPHEISLAIALDPRWPICGELNTCRWRVADTYGLDLAANAWLCITLEPGTEILANLRAVMPCKGAVISEWFAFSSAKASGETDAQTAPRGKGRRLRHLAPRNAGCAS